MVGIGELARVFFVVGLTSWGGPAIVAQIREAVVLRRRWLTEEEFRQSLAFIQLLPGPTAPQVATHIGWRLHGTRGAMAALCAYIAPSSLLMLAFSVCYARWGALPSLEAALRGMRAASVGIVVGAILSLGTVSLRGWRACVLALVALPAFFLGAAPLLVLAASGLLGALLLRQGAPDAPRPPGQAEPSSPPFAHRASILFVALFAGLFTVAVLLASRVKPVLAPLLGAMVHANLLAFGGGYTAVAVMHDSVVVSHPWLTPHEFMDGLAMAQITPGPVTALATFVGHAQAGLAGALVATAGAFFPSALLLLIIAPHFERVLANAIVRGATRGLLAAFVAMLLALLWQLGQAAITTPLTFGLTLAAIGLLAVTRHPAWIVAGSVALALLLGR